MDFRFLAALGITMALWRPYKEMKMAVAPGTGNHKGCPYNRFAGGYFHSNDRKGGGL